MTTHNNKTQFHLTDLLYYNPSERVGEEIKKALREYQFILRASDKAVQHFLDGDLEKFDALVGENSCHIRAIKITTIASKEKTNFIALKEQIAIAFAKVEKILKSHSSKSLTHDQLSLEKIIHQENLNISLTSEEMFVVLSYILTEIKEKAQQNDLISSYSILIKEKSVPSKLKGLLPDVSVRFLTRLTDISRILLSQVSVQFVKNIASEFQDTNLNKMLTEYLFEHNSLLCAPSFWTFKALFMFAQRKGIPIVLHVKFMNETREGLKTVDEEFIHFKHCNIKNSYIDINPSNEDYNLPVCVIEGVALGKGEKTLFSKEDWKTQVLQTDLLDMIYAAGADHRQYPDPNQTIDLFDEEYENYKKLAETKGFSLNNPSLFFVRHIYSSKVGKKIPLFTVY